MKVLDPYDLWASPFIGRIKQACYRKNTIALSAVSLIVVLDWLWPITIRSLLGVTPHNFPHLEAMGFLAQKNYKRSLYCFAVYRSSCGGWGLPFSWYSKNGVYEAHTPYVTNTPYVMEALLVLADQPEVYDEAMNLFHGTWNFLESLKVMHKGKDDIALSYAPVEEPRIVVNANSYAAFAYALHSVHGKSEVRDAARLKARRLAQWVVCQQQADGSWFYYADREPGNFIDCFHSCFVIKNLLKVKRLLPDLADIVDQPIQKGWRYIKENFFDRRAGLCRRFTVRSHWDPFRWDLYDQAEFLGLLVDFGELEWAVDFAGGVEKRFSKGGNWYCRIDIFGRRWGKNFLRWGIMPFWYHRSRLETALRDK